MRTKSELMLVVEPDDEARDALCRALRSEGLIPIGAPTLEAARNNLEMARFGGVIIDSRLVNDAEDVIDHRTRTASNRPPVLAVSVRRSPSGRLDLRDIATAVEEDRLLRTRA